MNTNKWPEPTFFEAVAENNLGGLFVSLCTGKTPDLANVSLPEPVRCDPYLSAWEKLHSKDWKPLNYYFNGSVGVNPIERYKMAFHLPHVSVVDPTKVAFYQSPDKLRRGIETRIKPAAYYKRYVNPNASEELLAQITRCHMELSDGYKNILHFAENDDPDTWVEVYESGYISSCMSNSNYNLSLLEACRCYCTSAFGLPDNGLRLAWLAYSPDEADPCNAVARAIVHQPTMTYVRVYGDDRLKSALEAFGYTQADGYPEGLQLATWLADTEAPRESGGVAAGFAHPYVDGDLYQADFVKNSGKPYFQLAYRGDYGLDSVGGLVFTSRYDGCERFPVCEITGEVITYDDEVCSVWDQGRFVVACESVYEDCAEALYLGEEVRVYNPDNTIDAMDSDGNSYDFLDMEENHLHYGIKWSEYHQEYIYGDDVVFCESVQDYLFESDCVEIDGQYYPEHNHRIAYCQPDNEPALKSDCHRLNGLWFKLEDLEEVDGKTVPVEGLDDDLREEILNG